MGGGSIVGGNNLDAGTSCLLGPANSNADLKLGPVLYDAGPTKTVLPGYGSKAIDFGNDAICAAAPVSNLDQRGQSRPVGPHCDAGAVEVTTHLYVKADATGANNGLSWTDAFVDLQVRAGGAEGPGSVDRTRDVQADGNVESLAQLQRAAANGGVWWLCRLC